MARVTSKLQVTIPKAMAERYGIEPGQEIEWIPAGEAIRVVPPAHRRAVPDRARRLELFDRATERQRVRQSGKPDEAAAADRGRRRDDLHRHGRTG
jgi:bifunctional DNA-binding transcriptional regulator/antitoxin component of YhaV-PrlF toxin-antitoxin module